MQIYLYAFLFVSFFVCFPIYLIIFLYYLFKCQYSVPPKKKTPVLLAIFCSFLTCFLCVCSSNKDIVCIDLHFGLYREKSIPNNYLWNTYFQYLRNSLC